MRGVVLSIVSCGSASRRYTAEEWNDEEPVVPGVKAVKKRAVKKQAKGFFACC